MPFHIHLALDSITGCTVVIDKKLFDEVVDFLLPMMGDPDQRDAVVRKALHGEKVLNQIKPDGNPLTYTNRLVNILDHYGRLESGNLALVALLIEYKNNVGVDRQNQIDQFIIRIQSAPILPINDTTPQSTVQNNSKPNRTFYQLLPLGLFIVVILLVIVLLISNRPTDIPPPIPTSTATATDTPTSTQIAAIMPTDTATSTLTEMPTSTQITASTPPLTEGITLHITYTTDNFFIYVDPQADGYQTLSLRELEIAGTMNNGNEKKLRLGDIFDFQIANDIIEPTCFILRPANVTTTLVGVPDGCDARNAEYSIEFPASNVPWRDNINGNALGVVQLRLNDREYQNCNLSEPCTLTFPLLE